LAIKKAQEQLKKVQKLASQLDGQEIEFVVKVGKQGELFESINQMKIAKKLKEMGFDIKKTQVELEKGLEAEIRVIVVSEEENE